jgi:plastocyanin
MAQRVIWTAIVGLFALLAVLAPAKIIRQQNRNDDAVEEPAQATPAAAGQPAAKKAATGTLVTMQGLKFGPKTLVVNKGDTVRFDNKDLAPHTVTSKDPVIDSGTLNPGQSFQLVVNKPFDYFCTIHPSMKASIELSG